MGISRAALLVLLGTLAIALHTVSSQTLTHQAAGALRPRAPLHSVVRTLEKRPATLVRTVSFAGFHVGMPDPPGPASLLMVKESGASREPFAPWQHRRQAWYQGESHLNCPYDHAATRNEEQSTAAAGARRCPLDAERSASLTRPAGQTANPDKAAAATEGSSIRFVPRAWHDHPECAEKGLPGWGSTGALIEALDGVSSSKSVDEAAAADWSSWAQRHRPTFTVAVVDALNHRNDGVHFAATGPRATSPVVIVVPSRRLASLSPIATNEAVGASRSWWGYGCAIDAGVEAPLAAAAPANARSTWTPGAATASQPERIICPLAEMTDDWRMENKCHIYPADAIYPADVSEPQRPRAFQDWTPAPSTAASRDPRPQTPSGCHGWWGCTPDDFYASQNWDAPAAERELARGVYRLDVAPPVMNETTYARHLPQQAVSPRARLEPACPEEALLKSNTAPDEDPSLRRTCPLLDEENAASDPSHEDRAEQARKAAHALGRLLRGLGGALIRAGEGLHRYAEGDAPTETARAEEAVDEDLDARSLSHDSPFGWEEEPPVRDQLEWEADEENLPHPVPALTPESSDSLDYEYEWQLRGAWPNPARDYPAPPYHGL